MQKTIFALIITAILLAACAAPAPRAISRDFAAEPAFAPEKAAVPQAAVEKSVAAESVSSEVATDTLLQDRKVIYNANLSLVVTDTEETARRIETLASEMGGYIANMNAYRGDEEILFYDITLRVPANRFEETRAGLRDMAVRVENESVNTDDVTDQYYDLDARLRTLKATESELLDLLKETRERGGSVEDIMSIYRELSNIQGQIESLQGQLNRLDKLVALSTFSVHLRPDELTQPLTTPWRPQETLRNSVRVLIKALQGLVNLFIYLLVVALPILLVLLIPILLLLLAFRWFIRRRRQKKNA